MHGCPQNFHWGSNFVGNFRGWGQGLQWHSEASKRSMFLPLPLPTMVSFPKNHADTKKLNGKLSSNKKRILKKVLKLHPKIFAEYFFRNYNVRLLEKWKIFCHYTHMGVAWYLLFLTNVLPLPLFPCI